MIKAQILCTCAYFVPAVDRSLLLSDPVSCIQLIPYCPSHLLLTDDFLLLDLIRRHSAALSV